MAACGCWTHDQATLVDKFRGMRTLLVPNASSLADSSHVVMRPLPLTFPLS